MLSKTIKPFDTDLFRIPFTGPICWSDLIEMYPKLTEEMNGESYENCLLFYYELNPVSNIYEFRDETTELDFADILKIDMDITRDGESKKEKEERVNSYNDMFNEFLQEEQNVNDNSDINYKKLKEEIKKAKKERRQQKLLDRKN